MDQAKFWDKVDQTGDCWIWTAGKNLMGYGNFRYQGKTHNTHKLAYEFTKGPVSDGFHLHHLCENKACVNPDHLIAMSPQDHGALRRMTHCQRGHELTPENTIVRVTRKCRACERERQKTYRKSGADSHRSS